MKTSHILVILACSLFFLSLTNYLLINALQPVDKNSATQEIITTPDQTNKGESPGDETVKHYPLVPEDPAKYGIVSIPEAQIPNNQLGWDVQMKAILVDSKLFETPEGKNAVQQMQTSQKNFQDIMGRVDKDLANFENLQKKNPLDKDVEKRLQTLYKLKAMGKILQEKVVTLPDPAEGPTAAQRAAPNTTEQNLKNVLSAPASAP